MHLGVAFVPPVSVLNHVADHLDLPSLYVEGLLPVPFVEAYMSMTVFGNVSRGDVANLVQALSRASESWPPAPTVHLAGGAALEWPGDTSVWAKTDGEVEAMHEVARSIAPTVGRIGFAVDRRRFRPWLPMARVTPTTELSALEGLLATLDAYRGPDWTVTQLSLVRTTTIPGRPGTRGFETVREFPLPSP